MIHQIIPRSLGIMVDLMFDFDHSGSQSPEYEANKALAKETSRLILTCSSKTTVGLMQMGVDGDTGDPGYSLRSLILQQPTRSFAAMDAAFAVFPGASGAAEWETNSFNLAITGTTWTTGNRRFVAVFTDESLYQTRIGSVSSSSTTYINAAIAAAVSAGVVFLPVITDEAAYTGTVKASADLLASGTGGQVFVEPTAVELKNGILEIIG